MLPARSPLGVAANLVNALSGVGDALRKLGSLLKLLPLGPISLGDAIDANAAHTHVAVQDEIGNLNDWTLIQRSWYENDTEAEDEISSLILVGVPGTSVRLYNARNFGEGEGVLQVTTGDEGYVLLRDLNHPLDTEPAGRSQIVRPPSNDLLGHSIGSTTRSHPSSSSEEPSMSIPPDVYRDVLRINRSMETTAFVVPLVEAAITYPIASLDELIGAFPGLSELKIAKSGVTEKEVRTYLTEHAFPIENRHQLISRLVMAFERERHAALSAIPMSKPKPRG